MVVALAAVLVGVCALVVSVVQARVMQEQQHASVWPSLVVTRSHNESGLRVLVTNPGLGPAVIRDVRASVDAAPAATWADILRALAPEQLPFGAATSTVSGRVVAPGEAVEALSIPDPDVAATVAGELHRVEFEVCYCSVYERCWVHRAPFGGRAGTNVAESCGAEGGSKTSRFSAETTLRPSARTRANRESAVPLWYPRKRCPSPATLWETLVGGEGFEPPTLSV